MIPRPTPTPTDLRVALGSAVVAGQWAQAAAVVGRCGKSSSERGEMGKQRVCSQCGTVTDTFCPTCVAAFPKRRDATAMTTEERVTELERWCGPLEIPMDLLHQRIEELVGRPVWTHELARPEALAAEIRSGQSIGMGDVLNKLTEYAPQADVIVVATEQ